MTLKQKNGDGTSEHINLQMIAEPRQSRAGNSYDYKIVSDGVEWRYDETATYQPRGAIVWNAVGRADLSDFVWTPKRK